MKSFLVLLSLTMLVSCGARKKVITQIENNYDDSATQARLADLENRVAILESTVNLNISQISVNSVLISGLQSQLSSEVLTLQNEIALLTSQLQALEEQSGQDFDNLSLQIQETNQALADAIAQGGTYYSSIMANISTLNSTTSSMQNSINTLVTQVAQLQLNQTVVEVVDPCPSVPSNDYKEMLLKMNSGVLVAYFEDGGKRFLTVLGAGNYRTTDRRACNFTVNANNTIN